MLSTNLPCSRCQVLAHLIKAFLRGLPGGGLLGAVPRQVLAECDTIDGCLDMFKALSRAERAVLEWLVRVIVEVATRGAHNKMGIGQVRARACPCPTRRQLTACLAPPNSPQSPPICPRQLCLVLAPNLIVPAPNVPSNPLEELLGIEFASNMLHTLAASSMRFTL